MKVAVVSKILDTKSGSRAPIELAKGFTRLQHPTTIFALTKGANHNLLKQLKKFGLNVLLVKNSLALFWALKRYKPDVISFHSTPPYLIAAWLAHFPIVKTYYGTQLDAYLERFTPEQTINTWQKLINKVANTAIKMAGRMEFMLASETVTISKFAAKQAKSLFGKTTSVVYLGGNHFGTSGNKKTNKTVSVLAVSRLTPYKGFHLLFKAARKNEADSKLIIVGSKEKEAYFKYLARIKPKNCQILTDISDEKLGNLYKNSSFLVSADRYQFFGLPIAEAAFFGKPTLALNYAAAPELIEHEKTGFVANNIEEFINYYSLLTQKPGLTKRLGEAAKKRAKKLFVWHKTAKEYGKIFHELKLDKGFIFSSLFLVLIAGLFLRILFLQHHDFWFDEAFSLSLAKQGIPELLVATAADNNPPLYYLALHAWMLVAGNGEITLRILSIFFGFGALLIFYIFAKTLFGSDTALYATIPFTLSPLLVYFSAETRMYTLFVFLTLLSNLFWVKFMRRQTLSLAALFLSSFILALYTHYYAFLLLVSFLFVTIQKPGQKRWIPIGLLSVAFLLTVPWIRLYFQYPHPELFAQPSILALPATFVSFVLDGTGVVSLRTFFFQQSPILIKSLFIITLGFILLLGIKGAFVASKNRAGKTILEFLFLPLLLLTLGNLFLPIFSVRSTVFLAPYFFILVGLGIKSLPPKLTKPALVIIPLVFVSIILALLANPIFRGPPIRETLREIPKETPVLHTSVLTYYPFWYYQRTQENSFLVTRNPLSPVTIGIIGGATVKPKIETEEFIVLEIIGGADPSELASFLTAVEKSSKLVSSKQIGPIKIKNFKITKSL